MKKRSVARPGEYLLVSPTRRCLEVGERETETALDSRLYVAWQSPRLSLRRLYNPTTVVIGKFDGTNVTRRLPSYYQKSVCKDLQAKTYDI